MEPKVAIQDQLGLYTHSELYSSDLCWNRVSRALREIKTPLMFPSNTLRDRQYFCYTYTVFKIRILITSEYTFI